jgi:hypothetical protein
VWADDTVLPQGAQDDHELLSYRATIYRIISDAAIKLVYHGIALILERFVVAQHKVLKDNAWLLNAGKMLAIDTNDRFKLYYTEPAIGLDGGRPSALISIRGVNSESPSKWLWTYSTRIDSFLIASAANLTVPYKENIAWRTRPESTELDSIAGFRTTPGGKLALLITATLDGVLRSKADAGNLIRAMITRLVTPPAVMTCLFGAPETATLESIRNLMPWQVAAYPNYGGIVLVVQKPSVMQGLADSVSNHSQLCAASSRFEPHKIHQPDDSFKSPVGYVGRAPGWTKPNQNADQELRRLREVLCG